MNPAYCSLRLQQSIPDDRKLKTIRFFFSEQTQNRGDSCPMDIDGNADPSLVIVVKLQYYGIAATLLNRRCR